MSNNKLVKMDFNMIENPFWFIDKNLPAKSSDDIFCWEDKNGFVYSTPYKPTTKVDWLFLLWLLEKVRSNNWNNCVEFTFYQVMKDCKMSINNNMKSRLKDSLKRWLRVYVKFKGDYKITWKNKKKEKNLEINFSLLESFGLREDGKTSFAKVNEYWVNYMKESQYYKLISFSKLVQLRSPTSLMLYGILCKSLYHVNTFEIDVFNLKDKMRLDSSYKYPSLVITKIKKAIEAINKVSKEKYTVSVKKKKKDPSQQKFIFKKVTMYNKTVEELGLSEKELSKIEREYGPK